VLGLRAAEHLERVRSRSTGKERDAESGNDYFEARYYSSAMGRFMSPDWSAKEEPVPYAKLDDPQTLNLYSYVQNNPLIHVDADGHCGEDACVIEGGATLYFAGAALLAGGAAVLRTPEGQRSLSTFTNAVSENFSSNVSALKNKITSVFSKTQHEATNEAKKDAGVPTSQQPSSQKTVPVTDSNGKQIVTDGKPQTSRETTHTTGDGKTVVIQVHGQGHTYPDGGTVGPHVNVRPVEDTRHGTVDGTKPHYPFTK
jgi:RHS repeat-associated protein